MRINNGYKKTINNPEMRFILMNKGKIAFPI